MKQVWTSIVNAPSGSAYLWHVTDMSPIIDLVCSNKITKTFDNKSYIWNSCHDTTLRFIPRHHLVDEPERYLSYTFADLIVSPYFIECPLRIQEKHGYEMIKERVR
jgi:hypothetical protein